MKSLRHRTFDREPVYSGVTMKTTWRTTLLFAGVFGLATTLSADRTQPIFNVQCVTSEDSLGECLEGSPDFLVTGSGFPKVVLVVATDTDGNTGDDSQYDGPDLNFNESLNPGTWTIDVYNANGRKLLATTTVTVVP